MYRTTNQKQDYAFADTQAQWNTTYYYRLRQLDTDGKSSFSPVQTASLQRVLYSGQRTHAESCAIGTRFCNGGECAVGIECIVSSV
ncbi:MAG: hypothetical protein RIS64_4088 [Bacteroidota bacterium]